MSNTRITTQLMDELNITELTIEQKLEKKNEASMEKLRKYVGGTDAYPYGHEKYQKNADKFSPYLDAKSGIGSVFMGREKDTWAYRNPEVYYKQFAGRVSNCEEEGVRWTLEWNMAYWLGAIEAKREFEFVTAPDDILKRAIDGLKKIKKNSNDFGANLGGAFPELCWVFDNDYSLVNRKGTIFAIPPKKFKAPVFIDPSYEKHCLSPKTNHPSTIEKVEELIYFIKKKCDQLKTTHSPDSKKTIPTYRPSQYNTLQTDSLYLSKLPGTPTGKTSPTYIPPHKRNLQINSPSGDNSSSSNWRNR
ncbi:MAG: hypothetical protein JO131_09975 [Gammaproteobacteria bacterium]|nr:hypothetical protein [Gammaproteobacteria bacterium]